MVGAKTPASCFLLAPDDLLPAAVGGKLSANDLRPFSNKFVTTNEVDFDVVDAVQLCSGLLGDS